MSHVNQSYKGREARVIRNSRGTNGVACERGRDRPGLVIGGL